MSNYTPKFMDETKMAEMDELLQGEHKEALVAFGLDCGFAALEGHRERCVRDTLLMAGGGLLIFGAVGIGKKIINKCKEKKLGKSK